MAPGLQSLSHKSESEGNCANSEQQGYKSCGFYFLERPPLRSQDALGSALAEATRLATTTIHQTTAITRPLQPQRIAALQAVWRAGT